jgi:hypothetical protein
MPQPESQPDGQALSVSHLLMPVTKAFTGAMVAGGALSFR